MLTAQLFRLAFLLLLEQVRKLKPRGSKKLSLFLILHWFSARVPGPKFLRSGEQKVTGQSAGGYYWVVVKMEQ